jgi:hypothetical protein
VQVVLLQEHRIAVPTSYLLDGKSAHGCCCASSSVWTAASARIPRIPGVALAVPNRGPTHTRYWHLVHFYDGAVSDADEVLVAT